MPRQEKKLALPLWWIPSCWHKIQPVIRHPLLNISNAPEVDSLPSAYLALHNWHKSACRRRKRGCRHRRWPSDNVCSTIVSESIRYAPARRQVLPRSEWLHTFYSNRQTNSQTEGQHHRVKSSLLRTEASEEVTLQLVKSKCLPILLYGLATLCSKAIYIPLTLRSWDF